MLHQFWHLLYQSLRYMPSVFSTNWIAVIATAGIFVATELIKLWRHGWDAMKIHWKENLAIGVTVTVSAWLCLFGWSVVQTVYSDHQVLVAKANAPKPACPTCVTCQASEPCPKQATRNFQAKREIQSALSHLMKEGNALRDAWLKIMDKTELQQEQAVKAQQWHATVERYLGTIPRGETYLARLNSARKTGSGGYPLGLNVNVGGDYDLLVGDLNMLNEFIRDPELGEP